MSFWIEPLKGWRAAAWAILWICAAAFFTLVLWPVLQARFVFFLSAIAIVTARSGWQWGAAATGAAVAFTGIWLPADSSFTIFRVAAVLVTSSVLIMLAHLAGQGVAIAREKEAALHEVQNERERTLASERAMRAALERANRTKDEFLATLSHELRTPLMAILGWSQILKGGRVREDDLKHISEVIERNARMQVQLIEDLLDMNRIMTGKLLLDIQSVDLSETVTAAINTVLPSAAAKGVDLYKTSDGQPVIAQGDPARLQQCVWNLLTNAIKFTPAGGRVEVTVEKIDSRAVIGVKDTGVGIKPNFLPSVFDRFSQSDASSTRKHGGLGIGLAIVKNLVELHSGTIEASSEGENKGSTFCISLPLASSRDGVKAIAKTRSAAPHHELTGVRILVVDDEADTREMVQHVLEEAGASPSVASSAEDALAMVESENYEILISDIAMPRLDGFEFIRLLRASKNASTRGLPAIALTAYASSEDRLRALDAGFDLTLAKPIEIEDLISAVAHFVAANRI